MRCAGLIYRVLITHDFFEPHIYSHKIGGGIIKIPPDDAAGFKFRNILQLKSINLPVFLELNGDPFLWSCPLYEWGHATRKMLQKSETFRAQNINLPMLSISLNHYLDLSIWDYYQINGSNQQSIFGILRVLGPNWTQIYCFHLARFDSWVS